MSEIKGEIRNLRSEFAKERAEDKAEFSKKIEELKSDHPPMANVNIPSPPCPSPSTASKTYATATSYHGLPSSPNTRSTIPSTTSPVTSLVSPPRNTRAPWPNPLSNNKPIPNTNIPARPTTNTPNLTFKYAEINPVEHNVNIEQGLFPIGNLYEDKPEEDQDLLFVRCFAYNKNVAKFRTDDDTSDFSFTAVGELLVKAANLLNNNKGLVTLARAYEVESRKDTPGDRCVGQLAIKYTSEYHLSNQEKVQKLKEITQCVIMNKAHHDIDIEELPEYVQAFSFEINAVNYPHQVPFALVIGLSATWNVRLDRLGYDRLMEDLYAQMPVNDQGHLPKSLRTNTDRTSSLGALQYTSSSAVFEGKNGRAVCIVYACTPKGYQAALSLHEAFHEASNIKAYGNIPVTIRCFPPRNQPSPNRQTKNKKFNGDPVREFAKDSIEMNAKFTAGNYHAVVLPNLTDQIFLRKTTIDMCANYDHLVGVIPRCVQSPGNNTSLAREALLILHHNSSTTTRPSSFYRNIFEQSVPSIFPISVNNQEDDGFTTVPSKPQAKVTITNGNISDIMRNLDQKLHSDLDSNGKVWAIIYGRGGPRGAGVYPEYLNGIHGAKYMFHGISGGFCKSFDNENDAFKYFQQFYPGVDSWEKLRILWSCIPHTATNLHPLYPEFSGKISHRFNADAFTCVELDDDELLTERIQATTYVTGLPNGQPDDRVHYYRILKLLREKLLNRSHGNDDQHQPSNQDDSQPPHNQDNSNDNGEDNDDFSNYPNTQDEDFQDAMDNQGQEMDSDPTNDQAMSPNSPKKRKVTTNTSETENNNHFNRTDMNGMNWYTAPPGDTFHLTFIIVSIPPLACLLDAKLYFNKFKAGFGDWTKDQTQLCIYGPFPKCLSVIVGCPDDLIRDFRHFVCHTRFFNKYKVFSAIPYSHNEYHLTSPNQHKETMAAHPLIQHVKNVNHPCNDHILQQKIDESAGPQEVFEYYLKHLKEDSLDENSKELSDDWRSPPPSANFDPWLFEKDIEPNIPFKGIGTFRGIDEHF
jgi:hypothetical protein